MKPWEWVSNEYLLQIKGSKKIIKIEIDPSKRLADHNQMDNSIEILE